MCKRAFTLILILLVSYINIYSSVPKLSESSRVSLMTCSASDDAIYALFGHSGLRIKDDSIGIDVVFDYGIFDFSSNNFIFRFVKGETDYMVKGREFSHFYFEYQYRGIGVTEQVLNLTQSERQKVFEALITNSLPENRIYRYNFFYDNCATRPRDIISDNLDGKIEYRSFTTEQTYRDLLDECLVLTPWSRFGINLVIGSGADKVITERQKDFLPLYVAKAFDNANIIDTLRENRSLVVSSVEILGPEGSVLVLEEAKMAGRKALNQPFFVGIILLLAAAIVSYLQYKKNKRGFSKVFDTLLFFVAALAGSVIFFLTFFSEHPCVDSNWNLVWLNPLPFFFIPFFFVKSSTKYVISYHFVNFVVLTLFIVGFAFIPQTLEVAFIPYILALWLRSGVNVLEYRRVL